MDKQKNQSYSLWVGLLLGIGLVLMIPISENIASAKPTFDKTTLGIGCSQEYDKVVKLREKKAREGLTQAEASELGRAESNYNDICAGIYGSLPREVPNIKNPSIIGENAGVLDEIQPQNDQRPPLTDNEGIATDGGVQEEEQPNNPDTGSNVLDGGSSTSNNALE